MVLLPNYFKNGSLISLDDYSFVVHQQSINQKNIEVYLSQNMLVYILWGSKIFHTPNGDITLTKGEAVFAQRGTHILSEKKDDDGSFRSILFFVDDNFLKQFSEKYSTLIAKANPEWNGPELFKIESGRLINSHIESFLPYFSGQFNFVREVMAIKFEELFLQLIHADKQRSFLSFLNQIIHAPQKDIALFMSKNYNLPLTIDEFAQQTGYSLTSFKREFKKQFNLPPKQWINQKRLEQANTLLKTTQLNVNEICYEVGFETPSHFTQLFKRHYGVVPSDLIGNR